MNTLSTSRCCLVAIFILLTGCSREVAPHKISGDPLNILAANKVFDQFGVDGLRNDPAQGGKLLFANPASRFELPLDDDIKSVRFGFGIVATALINNPPTQGVDFRILYKDRSGQEHLIWSRKLNPLSVVTDRGQQTSTIPVGNNRYDKLIFETLPLQSPLACWAFWNAMSVERQSGN